MLRNNKKINKGQTMLYEEKPELEGIDLTSENIFAQIGESSDIIFRELLVNGVEGLPVTLVFVEGMIDSKAVDDDILKPLLQEEPLSRSKSEEEIINKIERGVIYHNRVKIRCQIDECIEDILAGSCALIFNGVKKAVIFNIEGYEKRAITEPTGENVIKGAKDAFVETLRVNTTLVRRKIKTQNLRIIETKVGVQTLTKVAVIYIEGLTNKKIVNELIKRLNNIDVDGAVKAGMIEQYIIDDRWSMYPQIMITERSDKLCQNLLDGRAGVIIDGIPSAYIVPAAFSMFLQAPEDDSTNYVMATVIRLIRYGAYLGSLLIPGFYIAITSFHQEMIPTELAISIIKSKIGVPFPTFFEVVFMLVAFELLIEAGLRLPQTIGQAISIVGAVVVGQAAVSAKLLSPAVIVVVALTGIAGFTMPNQDFSNGVRIWRFILVILAAICGLFGVAVGMLVMAYSLAKMESFGVPYLAPFVSMDGQEMLTNTFIRVPMFMQKKRPIELKTTNKKRQR